MKKKVIIIILLLSLGLRSLVAQSDGKADCFVSDFRFLCEKLESVHPNIYANLSMAEYAEWRTACETDAMQVKNNVEMQLLAAKFLAKIQDSHTRAYVKDDRHFPVKVCPFNGKFYVVGAESRDSIGYAVTHIDGMPVEKVLEVLGSYISAENEESKKMFMTECLCSPTWLSLIHNGNVPDTLSITMENGKISICAMEKCTTLLDTAYSEIYRNCRNPFSYRIDSINNVCVFSFNNMEDRACLCKNRRQLFQNRYVDVPLFSEFLIRMFQEMQSCGIQNLIVDLRHNQGGNSLLGDQLLYFIADKDEVAKRVAMNAVPRYSKEYHRQRNVNNNRVSMGNCDFEICSETGSEWFKLLEKPNSVWYVGDTSVHFYGKTYVLVSNSTYSSASDLAWYMSCLDMPLYGEVTAQPVNCFGDCLDFEMPHSKISFTVSCKLFYDKNAPVNNRVYPTVLVPYDYIDLRRGHDMPMESILKIINK